MPRKVVLENVQVGPHGELTAKILDKDGEDCREFVTMHGEMNLHYNNDQIASIVPRHPQPGQICVGKVGTGWHRVRLHASLNRGGGIYASCFMVDEGKMTQIPVLNLRQIMPRFTRVPHQMKQLELDGIKPLSLQISPEDLMVYRRSVQKWDSSAVSFISEYIKAATKVKAKIQSQITDSVISVKIYLYTRSGNRVCLNDLLVDKRYAVTLDYEDTLTLAIQKSDNIDGSSLDLQRLRIGNQRVNPIDQCAKSDIERAENVRRAMVRECVTDTEAVSSLSHRFLHRNTRNSSDRIPQFNAPVSSKNQPNELNGFTSISNPNSSRTLDSVSQERNTDMFRNASSSTKNTSSIYSGRLSRSPETSDCESVKTSLSAISFDNIRQSNPSHRPQSSLSDHCYNSDNLIYSRTGRNVNNNQSSSSERDLKDVPYTEKYSKSLSVSNNTNANINGASYMFEPISPAQSIGRGLSLSNEWLGPTKSMGKGSPCSSNPSPIQPVGRGALFSAISSPMQSLGRDDSISPKPCPPQSVGRGLPLSPNKEGGSASRGRGILSKTYSQNQTEAISTPGQSFQNVNQSKYYASDRESQVEDTPAISYRQNDELSVSNSKSQNSLKTNTKSSDLGRFSVYEKVSQTENKSRMKTYESGSESSVSCMSATTASIAGPENRSRLRSYISGNESSTSCMSAVAASVRGQVHAFTKSKKPKIAESQSSDERDQKLLPGNETSKTNTSTHQPIKMKSPCKSPMKAEKRYPSSTSESDSDFSTLHRKVMEAREKASTNRVSKSESLNDCVTKNIQPSIRTESAEDRKTEMLAKFSGEKLLKELSSNVTTSSQSAAYNEHVMAKPKSETAGMFGRVDNVVVHGKALKKPVYQIEGFPFIKDVFKHWENNKHAAPTLVQSYGWPSVMSGRHITAISPSGKGKTLTYLYVLITYLSGSNMYRELPIGMGPLVIILSKSWRRAEVVHHTAIQIVNSQKHKVLLVYGGGHEENRAFELINGCDIMVTTPPCLMRLLKKGYTDLRRLCHLVIDDCDHTLDTFHVEINYIKSEYSLVIQNEIKKLECPRQILVFGSQWNEVNSQFTENVLSEPILIITSPFEAAIYGRVRQIAHLCKSDRRMNELVGLLENIGDKQHKIIIFSSSKDDMHFLVEGLRAYSYNLIYVSEYMELYDVKKIADDWNRGARLLVCCDTHVINMNIADASVVIHYDLPNSKTKFGNRMSCMRQHFYNFATANKKKNLEPVSHVFVTENCGQQVRTIQELLKRSKAEFPKELKDFIAGMVERREEDDHKELCYQLLAYGTCRDKWRCGRRHVVIPKIDSCPETDWIPCEGQVKVLVTHVNDSDASHFYVRLLEVKEIYGSISQPNIMYVQLMLDLEMWFKKLENQTRLTAPYTGELCGYQDRGVFYRVQILDIPNMNTHGKGGSIEVSVKFVDIGKDMDIDLNKLYVLPIHLKEVPFQAVEVFVCRVKPVDKDPEWTIKASIFINELLYGKELEGKIVLKLGGILWLDPLVERVYLGEARTLINRSYVNDELIRHGFANENPTHLEKLYKLCEGKVKLPRLLLVKTKMSQILQTDALPLCRKYHDVHVSSVTSPDLFFIQRREKLAELEEVMEGIAQYIHDLEADDGMKELEKGQYCIAQYESFDQRWYRARVMEVLEDSYEIFFADYGDLDTVPKKKVKEFPVDKFFDLPLQAIECKLYGICTDQSLEKASGDALWDLSHFVNGDLKSLVTEVKSLISAEFSGRHRYVLEIFDTNGSENLNIAQELVHRQLVVKLGDNGIEDLFLRPTGLRRKIYSAPLEKVVDMVAMLYWEPDSTKAYDIAIQLLDLIRNSVSRSTEAVHPSMFSALHSLIKLTSHTHQFSIEAVIQDCILELINTGEQMSEELLQSTCLSNVVRCLEMDSNSSMQCQAAEFISNLCSVSSKIRNYIQSRDSNILSTLIELFEFTQQEEIKGCVCKAFTALCSGTESVFQVLMEKSVCTRLKTILQETSNHEVQEAVILLLSALSDHDRSHNDLKKESLIEAIVKNLNNTTCDKCIQHSVEFCDIYASTRRKHKTHLLELEMVPLLNRIIQLDIMPTTAQLCKDLISSLVVKFPLEPASGVQYMGDRITDVTNKDVSPEVHWCQTTFVIQLSVKIPECTRNAFVFTEQSVKFRDTLKGVRYAFHLDLFDKVIPSKCKVAIKSHEVLVSLYKEAKGRWPRLHRGKKPSWIFVDYERFVDSSSDSESYDESRPFVVKKKRKKKKLPADKSAVSEYRVISSASDTDNSLDYFDDPVEKDQYDIFA